MKSGAELVREALAASGKMQVELAAYMGWSKQNLNSRLKNDSLSYAELVKMMGFCGYEVKVLDIDRNELEVRTDSASPRLVKMVDGVTYDTGKAESICSTKKAPDDEFYTELFRDASGTFFVAYFELWEGDTLIYPPSTPTAPRASQSVTGKQPLRNKPQPRLW